MRRLIEFACRGARLVGTLDDAASPVGLLIVSGGNEIRTGAHRGMALLAADISALGHPVFRYDRRGIGDSDGDNAGFRSASDDLAAAAATFRREAPQVTRMVGFGNCDAASTLALYGLEAGVDCVVLANPWVVDERDDGLPPAAAIRARYAHRVISPSAWIRLVRGGVDLGKLAAGMRKVLLGRQDRSLADAVIEGITAWGDDAAILLAARDATAIAFRAAAPRLSAQTIDTSSHSFAGDANQRALLHAIAARLQANS